MTAKKQYRTREEWLEAMYLQHLRQHFSDNGHPMNGQSIRFSCGFPKGGRGKLVGQCWSSSLSKDGTHEIFISPALDAPPEVTYTLAHELIHANVGLEAGHRQPFRTVALSIGLTGPMTATFPTAPLLLLITDWCQDLGDYPHAVLSDPFRTKQTTRMIKCTCPECGYLARVSRKWIEEAGPPRCPDHLGPMQVDNA